MALKAMRVNKPGIAPMTASPNVARGAAVVASDAVLGHAYERQVHDGRRHDNDREDEHVQHPGQPDEDSADDGGHEERDPRCRTN